MADSTENMNEFTPETLDYTESDFRKENKRKIMKEGWIKGVVVKAERRVTAKSKNLEVKLHIAPVDENNVVFNWTVPMAIYPVMPNPTVPGHSGPNKKCLRNAYSLARSIDKDFPKYAKKSDTDVTKYILPTGETVDKKEAFKHNDTVDIAIKMLTKSWYENPSTLLDETFFVKVIHEQGLDGQLWAKALFTLGEEPKDEPVIRKDFISEL